MKKISLLILMLTFLLIPTCVNANGVSWEDFIDKMEEATSNSNFEASLLDSAYSTAFKNAYNNCKAFSVFGDFGFASTSPNQADNTKLWFVFYNGTPSITNGDIDFVGDPGTNAYYRLTTRNSTTVYTYTISNDAFSTVGNTNSQTLFYYYLNNNTTFSKERFLSESGADYFLDTSFVMAWNMSAKVQYVPNASTSSTLVTKVVDLSTIDDSNFPWEDGNVGGSGSGDTYYNYDFGEYFQKPWISIDNVQGLVQSTSTIPFKIMSQSGDEYYPFDKLKLDLRVYKIYTDENGNKTQSLFDTYKRYNGDYVDTSGYNSVTQNGKINVYNYDLRDKFDSNFIDTYLNSNSGDVGSGNVFDYAFQLVLYSFWEDELSSTKLFYFYENNNLNSGTIPDNYYDNNWNSGSGFDFENMNFDSVLNTAKNFLSSIFGFFSLFPDWLIYLLTFGVSVGIILRILGR